MPIANVKLKELMDDLLKGCAIQNDTVDENGLLKQLQRNTKRACAGDGTWRAFGLGGARESAWRTPPH